MRNVFIKSRPSLDHEAFNVDTHKKLANTKIKMYVDEMVKNGTPYLAMHLCPIYQLELSKNFKLSETTKSKFPFIEKMSAIFADGIAYDEKIKSQVKQEIKENPINLTNFMGMINQLELDEDEEIENIISRYV